MKVCRYIAKSHRKHEYSTDKTALAIWQAGSFCMSKMQNWNIHKVKNFEWVPRLKLKGKDSPIVHRKQEKCQTPEIKWFNLDFALSNQIDVLKRDSNPVKRSQNVGFDSGFGLFL